MNEDLVTARKLYHQIEIFFDLVPDVSFGVTKYKFSVLNKSKDIMNRVEESGNPSEKQLDALQNMLTGFRKWVSHEDGGLQ